MKSFVSCFLFFCCSFLGFNQSLPYNILFDDTLINAVYITIDADSLEELYENLENEHEYAVQFIYATEEGLDTVQNVGFRLRGNTSLFSAKKSFKVSFNTYQAGRKFNGLEKLNLIGNHNDPSMAREKLYFDLYEDWGLPVRRTSFVKLFINTNYYGLYTNLEEYDEIFVKDRFGENTGNLYKCIYGSNLTYRGESASAYDDNYELKTNKELYDYRDLIQLTNIISNTPISQFACELEKVFNIDGFLKIYALDIASGHWDNYGYNQNNFFLYHNQYTNKFEFLSYDCDNTFGVDWSGVDWATQNIYSWINEDRPLVEKLMQIQEYKDRLSYYCHQIVTTVYTEEALFPHIDSIKTLISPAALIDLYRTYDYGYTYTDFLNSFTTNNIDGHTPYGIKNFITQRINSTLDQVELNDIIPIINHTQYFAQLPQPASEISISATLLDDEIIVSAQLFYSFDSVAFFEKQLYDDGAHNDQLSGDGFYTAQLVLDSEIGHMYYYFRAEDNASQVATFPQCGSLKLSIGAAPSGLVINEIMAINAVTIADNKGDFDDYIELYNTSANAIYLGDKYLSNDFDKPTKWQLPNVNLNANEYLIIWADNETFEGDMHTNFTLDGSKGQIAIFDGIKNFFSPIDSLSFLQQESDIALGRLPNGIGSFIGLPKASPGIHNEALILDSLDQENQLILTNNPSQNSSELIVISSTLQSCSIALFSNSGALISQLNNGNINRGVYTFTIEKKNLQAGIYFLNVELNNKKSVLKLLVVG